MDILFAKGLQRLLARMPHKYDTLLLGADRPADVPALKEVAAYTQWELAPPDGVFTGRVLLDGSGLRGRCTRRRRCGFAVVMLDNADAVVGILYGALPGPVQSVAAAELWALRALLRHCMPPLDVASDCRFVVDGMAAGPAATTQATQVHAGIWRAVWREVAEIGADVIHIRKVPAHATAADVQAHR